MLVVEDGLALSGAGFVEPDNFDSSRGHEITTKNFDFKLVGAPGANPVVIFEGKTGPFDAKSLHFGEPQRKPSDYRSKEDAELARKRGEVVRLREVAHVLKKVGKAEQEVNLKLFH